MIELRDIRKTYKINNLEVLKGIDIKFNDLGFVSILGPSGCGKTSLLNIIGGLDKPSSGDIIIDGISTQEYSDKDWDHYRNENIGFVFQDFNLINHLSAYKNVELSLTLTGIKRKERRKKVLEALSKVGLTDKKNSLPRQLSGGEKQRVAIARAIVNNPRIILADEPTGALDSENSKQILNILKEISKSHLVIMVTHNIEAANIYATKIVKLLDGKVTESKDINIDENISSNIDNKKHKKMPFLSAISLSFKNLILKWPRSILTIIAGSIGIIGVSLVIAVSSGVTNYIVDVQKVALGNYPITVTSSVKSSPKVSIYDNIEEFPSDDKVIVVKGDTYYEHINTIEEEFFDYFDQLDKSLYSWVDYNRTIKLNILSKNGDDYSKISTSYMYEMTDNIDVVNDSYDCLVGHFPTEYNEIAILVDSYNCIDANILSYMGMDYDREFYTFDELLNQEFKVLTDDELYVKIDDRYYTYGSSYYEGLYNNAKITLKVCGIMRVKPQSSEIYSSSFLYTKELTNYVYNKNLESDIVKEQLEYGLEKDVFYNKPYEDEVSLSYTLSKEYVYESRLKDLGLIKQVNRFYIYTDNFSSRLLIEDYIDKYNEVNPDSFIKITYSDYMKRITEEFSTFVKILTKVLIIFALVSLLVSSILIAIISYISVLERTKEIGILRSIGASKFDIYTIFSSETMLIGFASGILGSIGARLFSSPISSIVKRLIQDNSSITTGLSSFKIVNFTIRYTLLIIVGSCILTVVSGIIPTIIASVKKPIDALRSNDR